MDRFVRITLEREFVNRDGEPQDVLALRYGTEPAVHRGQYTNIGGEDYIAASPQVNGVMISSDYVQNIDPRSKYIPGKPIVYDLKWSDEGGRSAVVAEHVAKHYFGDWVYKPGFTGQTAEQTHPAEKRRITQLWGDYRREPRDRNVGNHWRSLRKIGAPSVPHVVIHRLDSAYRMVPGFEYRPWESFAWDKEVYLTAVPTPQATQGLVGAHGQPLFSMTPEMQAMIAAQVQEQVAAALKGSASRKAAA